MRMFVLLAALFSAPAFAGDDTTYGVHVPCEDASYLAAE